MADGTSNETIRQMLSGFNGMQAALGLLPPSTGGPSIGLGPAVITAPPPPPILHPSEAAIAATQQQQTMMQQTMAAAQMTRFTPPPSAPTPSSGMGFGWGGTMGQMASQQLNPFAAAGLSGSGYGMPSPSMMTSPSYGMFRPGGNGPMSMGGAHVPSIFNPFAPTMPSSHFSAPAMHGLQMMQARQSQMVSAISGVGEFGLGAGGSVVGGALGSAFGPLGTLAGSYLGGKVGHAAGNLMFGPAMHDMAQGRQIQRMTAPFMTTGSFLSAGGQGLNTDAGRQVATGLRHMYRDRDFEHTGFNTADASRIMNLSGQQGLLTGAQNPADILHRVKEISKTVKVLMQITGDPDVRDAIASLGQMRNLGFQGLNAQAGAVANRSAFARMAGVSQSAAHEMFGMPGAMMAQQVGLAGSTGYAAGMAGGGLANIAASSGSLNDLQLARAGGRSGLAQINTMAQVSAMQSDLHLMASLKRGGKGLEVDMDAFRRSQSMTPGEVAREAAERTQKLGADGIFEWRTRRQEFKDQIAQKLSPLEMNLNVVRQASALQKQVPGMNLGAAIYTTVQSNAVGAGMGEEQAEQTARALELQFSNRSYWDGQVQQLRAQRRQATDQDRAHRERYRTPGVMSRAGRGVRNFLGGVGDHFSSPFQRASDHFRRVGEDEEAAKYGEHIGRFSDVDIAHNAGERSMMRTALGSREFQEAFAVAGGSPFGQEGTGGFGSALGRSASRQWNRMGSFLGLSSQNDSNRLVSIASRSEGSMFGLHPFGSFGDTGSALRRVNSVTSASKAVTDAGDFNVDKALALQDKLSAGATGKQGFNAASLMQDATQRLITKLPTAGVIKSAGAVSQDELRSSFIEAAKNAGLSDGEAAKMYESNKTAIHAQMAKNVLAGGDQKMIETFMKAQDVATDAGAISAGRSHKAIENKINDLMHETGLKRGALASEGSLTGHGFQASDSTLQQMKSVLTHNDAKTVAVAAAINASMAGSAEAKENAKKFLAAEMQRDPREFAKRQAAAQTLLESMDDKTKQGFRQLGSTTSDFNKQVGNLGAMFGGKMALASSKSFVERMSELSGNKGGAGTPEDAIRQVSDDDLDRLAKSNPEKAALLRRAKHGDKKALEDAVASAGPTSTEERFGGGAGEASQRIDKQIADIESMRDQMGDSADPTAKLGAASSELFANSVKSFADAVNELKGNSEKNALSMANPWWMAKSGGS